jgi:hypothetical protein
MIALLVGVSKLDNTVAPPAEKFKRPTAQKYKKDFAALSIGGKNTQTPQGATLWNCFAVCS